MEQEEDTGKLVKRTLKTYDFAEFDLQPLRVVVPEVLDGQYGMYTWPCAPVLARYIWTQQDRVRGQHVLELGSGTSLAGVAAALVGAATVVLSEQQGQPQLLDNCRRTCLANNIKHSVLEGEDCVSVSTGSGSVQIIGLSWASFSPTLLSLPPFDIILGSDCFYDDNDYEDIVSTVAFLLERSPTCHFWTTYQERNSSHNISALLARWQLEARSIPLESFDGERITVNGKTAPPAHSIHMLDIWRKT